MKQFLAAAVLALATTFANTASAASLGLPTTDPTITAGDTSFSFFGFGLGGNGLASGVVSQTSGTSSNPFFLSITYGVTDFSDPITSSFGFLSIDGFPDPILNGDLIGVGFSQNTLELQFGNLSGPGANEFNQSVLATFTSPDFGSNPFNAIGGGQIFETSASVTVANVVPLPGALGLLLSGFAGFAWLRRRKAATA